MLVMLSQCSPNFCFSVDVVNVRKYGTKASRYVQSDWDYIPLARMLGARNIVCDCGATDGSVNCPHRTASEMIAAAYDWLSANADRRFRVSDDTFDNG